MEAQIGSSSETSLEEIHFHQSFAQENCVGGCGYWAYLLIYKHSYQPVLKGPTGLYLSRLWMKERSRWFLELR